MTDFVRTILGIVLQSINNEFSRADYRAWDLEMYLPSPKGPDPLYIMLFKNENGERFLKVKGFKREVVLTFEGLPVEYNGIKVSYFKKSLFNPKGSWFSESDMLQLVNRMLAAWHRDIYDCGYLCQKRLYA